MVYICQKIQSDVFLHLLTGETHVTAGRIKKETNRVQTDYLTDGLYEQLTVSRYLRTFQQLYGNYKNDLMQYREPFSLVDTWQTKIKI